MAKVTIESRKSRESYDVSESRIIPTYAEMKSRNHKFNFYIRTTNHGDTDLEVYGVTGNSGILYRIPGDTEVRFAHVNTIRSLIARVK